MRLLLIILILAGSQQTFALRNSGGGMATGGGSGVVCRDKDSNIKSVQLLDLYEAQFRYHLPLISSTGDEQKDYIDSVLRGYSSQEVSVRGIKVPSVSELQAHYKSFFETIHWTSPGEKIPLLKDQGSTEVLPQDCSLEQIAVFHDENATSSEFIEMQKDLWERLPALHRAALIWHELIYKQLRLLNDFNSEFTRAEVATIFSAKRIPVLDGLPSSAKLCTAYDEFGSVSKFYVFSSSSLDAESYWTLQFTLMMGRPLSGKTFAILDTKFPQLSNEMKRVGSADIFPVIAKNEEAVSRRVSLHGVSGLGLELLMEWQQNEPIAISIYQNGRYLGRSFVSGCTQ